MKLFIEVNLFLAWNFLFVLGGRMGIVPRLILKDRNYPTIETYPIYQKPTVFFHPEDSDDLYVGGTGFIWKIDVEKSRIIKIFPLNSTGEQPCTEGLCKNVITVIQKFQDSLFVCGSDGQTPQCWKLPMDNGAYEIEDTHGIEETFEGTGISPYLHTQNSLSLTVDGDLYAAAPLDRDGSSLQFRRKAGRRTNVWMYDMWVSEPTFISANWVKRTNDPENEKIYVFFREKNSDSSPEADPWISTVARVCKVDEGGSKRFFQNMWTSFLKARLVCGIPKDSLYFNRLQDIYVQHAEDWRQSRVYGLFTSSWNSTAVCIYSMEGIDQIFETSTFKGFDKEIPYPRPGQCVPNSKRLPLATVNVVKDHPEMSDWIHSIHHNAPFYISSNNYTKIAVDQVQAVDKRMHNVLLLATDSGRIHKVLEDGNEPFIISEIQLSNHTSIIRSMELESQKKKLVVGLSEQIIHLDLQRCQDYNGSCADCVLARDPYCAWSMESGCTPTVPGSIQNIIGGQTKVCSEVKLQRAKRDSETESPSRLPPTVHSVPLDLSLDVPLYLSCPIDSYHAVYTWEHGDQSSPCLRMQSNCMYLISALTQGNYGSYTCVSKERDYNKTVKAYKIIKLMPRLSSVCGSNPSRRSGAEAVMTHRKWLMGLTAVVMHYLCMRACFHC